MFDASVGDEPAGGNFLQQLPVILWQRRWFIIVPTIIGIVAAVAAILLVPPVYRSNAIMLVESPQLPKEVLGTDSGNLIDRRIAAIRQQITARSRATSTPIGWKLPRPASTGVTWWSIRCC